MYLSTSFCQVIVETSEDSNRTFPLPRRKNLNSYIQKYINMIFQKADKQLLLILNNYELQNLFKIF